MTKIAYVTKNELKEQFKNFREELNHDLEAKFEQQNEKIDVKFEQQNEEIDEKFTQQNEEIDEKFTQQRSDFFDKIDPVLKEVAANSQERIINDHHIADHEERITKLEQATLQ